jgi:thiamine biosynthesis protein ThiI
VKQDAQGKVVCLVSGGIDSPVAAWLIIKKGFTPVFTYFDNTPFTDGTTQERAIETMKKLCEYASLKDAQLHIAPHGSNLSDFVHNCQRNLTCLLCKRMMYRVASRIALHEGAEAISTGEIIGEQASQTVRNLLVVSEALDRQVAVIRPLIGMNKTEVENIARKIGTFDVSTKPASSCTAAPPKPRTRAKLEEVCRAEKRLDVEGMIERALKGVKVLKI